MDTSLMVARERGSWIRRLAAALGAAMVVASAGIAACSGDMLAPQAPNSVAVPMDGNGRGALALGDAGEFHNSFLDFVFPRMKTAVARGKGRAELCVVIARAMRDFVVARKVGVSPNLIRDDIAGGDCVSGKGANGIGAPRLALAVDDVPVSELDVITAEIALAAAENLPVSTLSSIVNDRVAYARAYLPTEEADIVAAAGEIAVSSATYWDQNYAWQEQSLLEEAGLIEALSRIPGNGGDALRLRASTSMSGLLTPPDRRSDGWLTDIENSSWYPKARKVAVADISGAVRGGISGWRGGWQGVVAGAAIEGGAASAGGLIREVFKPWTK